MRLPFATQSYQPDSDPLSRELLVNLFAEQHPQTAKSSLLVRASPGIRLYGDTGGTGPIYRMGVQRTELYLVDGFNCWRVAGDGAGTFLGTLPADSDPSRATIAASDTQVVFVAPPYAYVYNSSTFAFGRTTWTDPLVNAVAFVDGFFVFTDAAGGGRFYASAAYDANTLNPLSFATTESNPDNLVTCADLAGEIWLFGQYTIEVWDAVGGDFPFQRQSGSSIARGCLAPRTVAVADGSFFWLGDDFIVYRSAGYQPQRISTFPIETAIADVSGVDANRAIGFATDHGGHIQYWLTLPTTGRTWVYDVATKLWHERSSSTWPSRHRAESAVRFGNAMMVGDSTSGKFGYLDDGTGTEFSIAPTRIATLPPLYVEGKRLFMTRLELEADVGNSPSNSITMDYSDDGGRTWSTPKAATTGNLGQYGKRIYWNRLGQFRQRSVRFTATGTGRLALYGATAEIQPGAV